MRRTYTGRTDDRHGDAVSGTVIAILAAGAASRMRGGDKMLEEVRGRPLLRLVAERALGTGAPVAVTLPPDRPARHRALAGLDVERAVVADASEGMGASMRAVAGLARGRAAMIVLADMPEIETGDMAAILSAAEEMPGRIVRAASEDGRPGQPVLFPAAIVPELALLSGDEGARRLLRGREVVACPLPGRRALVDLDTPEDWAAWRAR